MESQPPLLVEDAHHASSVSLFGIGLICGAAVGAALGMLFAPKPGEALRRDVAGSMGRFKRQASDTMSDLAVKGRRAWEAGRHAYNASEPGKPPMSSPISER